MTAVHSPTAADSGASASANFRSTTRSSFDVSPERVSTVATAVLQGVHEAIRAHDVTYAEFQAAKQWLMDLGEGGEWPLFLDVFVEHVVEEVAARTQDGTKGSILGPYYLPDQVSLPSLATLPMRADEKGDPLVFAGRVVDLAGQPLAGAELDIWHADSEGYYSGFAPDIPARGVFVVELPADKLPGAVLQVMEKAFLNDLEPQATIPLGVSTDQLPGLRKDVAIFNAADAL